MIPNIGPIEIVVVLIIALVVFGPKRIPELGSSLGRGIRDFGKGIKGEDDEAAVLEKSSASEPEKASSVSTGS
jgi:sec-independent protein translocase protein TatA